MGSFPPRSTPLTVMIGCFIGCMFNPVVLIFFTLGLFFAPIQAETGWSMTQLSLVIPAETAAVALMSPVIGALLDRHGPRRVVIPSTILVGLAMGLFHLVQSIAGLYLLFVLLGLFCSGMNMMSFAKVISAWFDGNRGLMLGIAASGTGIGTLLVSPLTQWMIENWGWRSAYAGLGAILLFVSLPAQFLLLRDRPAGTGRQESAAHAAEPAISFAQMARSRSFLLILASFFLQAGAVNTAGAYLAPVIQENGAPIDFAVLCVSVFGAALFGSRLLTGFLLDRVFAPLLCAGVFSAAALSLAILAAGGRTDLALVAAALLGVAAGTEGDALGYLISRYFPHRQFGRVYSLVFTGYMISISIYPVMTGVLKDLRGSYQIPLIVMAATFVASAALILCLGRYDRAAETPASGHG